MRSIRAPVIPWAANSAAAASKIRLVHRQDGVHSAAADVSAAKARDAALFNRPSAAGEQLVGNDERPTLRLLTSVLDGVLPIQGGLPLHDSDDVLIGAVGVSGGTPDEDERVAQAAIDGNPKGTR
jgi:glc operon protein GlcG